MSEQRRVPGPDGGGGNAGAVAAWIGWWLACAVLWLAFTDTTHVPELIAGAGVSVIGASAALIVRQQRRLVLRPRPAWLLRLWRPLALYPRDLWLLVRALPRRGGGRFVAIEYDPGDDDPRDAARRVLIQAAASFAPNTFALGTDHEHGLLLVHELRHRADPGADSDPLGLR